jgi:hypothetical protein
MGGEALRKQHAKRCPKRVELLKAVAVVNEKDEWVGVVFELHGADSTSELLLEPRSKTTLFEQVEDYEQNPVPCRPDRKASGAFQASDRARNKNHITLSNS